MLKINIEKAFKKDIHRDKKSGRYSSTDFEILKIIIKKLENQEEIDTIYKRHFLKGKLLGFESIHIKNDWLLIFNIQDDILNLCMIGSHTQVYKKFK